MIGIVAGTADAARRVEAVLGAMTLGRPGLTHDVRALAPDMAIAKAGRGRLAGDGSLIDGEDGVVVAFDGEIFDDDGPLADPGSRVARLYHDGDLDQLAFLNGAFAVIIADPARRRIVLAGDRLGTRSLFVWQGGARLTAASRLGALLSDDRVSKKMSMQGIAELLAYQRTVADHTQYADIRALPAASVWTHERGAMTRRRTRRLSWSRPDYDPREGARRLGDAVRRATARRLADPVRHGMLMSGGLDSRWVLGCARAAGARLPCVTVAPFDNQEVALARAAASVAGMPFRYLENDPARLQAHFDASVEASDGLFTAPINLFGLLPELARDHDVLLSGHGLDYTFRGYYLPCTTLRIAGSVTRLPRLAPIPDGTPETVDESLRVGMDRDAVSALMAPAARRDWRARRVAAMRESQRDTDLASPYDAWDAFILHALGRHYAYSDFIAMDAHVPHREVTFDSEVFDLYLTMPPAWRASGGMVHAAMWQSAPDMMVLPDANTGFSARFGFRTQIALLFGRAMLRRAGLFRAPPVRSPLAGHGSWTGFGALAHHDPAVAARVSRLPDSAVLLDSGLFDRTGLARVVSDHLDRRAGHGKLLNQLLTLETWFGKHGYDGVAADG